MPEIVAIATDHAGFELKAALIGEIAALGLTPLDLGTDSGQSVDYPDIANAVARALDEKKAQRAVLMCGSGIGMSIAANRHPIVRAALCHDALTARLAREHNDANVLVMGARLIGPETAKDCLKIFLSTPFDGGERHRRRVAKLA